MNKGRKYEVLIFAIILFLIVLACIMYLSIKKLEIPVALGATLLILGGVLPSYIGANTYQKKIQANGGKDE